VRASDTQEQDLILVEQDASGFNSETYHNVSDAAPFSKTRPFHGGVTYKPLDWTKDRFTKAVLYLKDSVNLSDKAYRKFRWLLPGLPTEDALEDMKRELRDFIPIIPITEVVDGQVVTIGGKVEVRTLFSQLFRAKKYRDPINAALHAGKRPLVRLTADGRQITHGGKHSVAVYVRLLYSNCQDAAEEWIVAAIESMRVH